MTIATTADEFHYQCSKCMTFEKPSDKDTLVYEDVTGTNLIIYKSILKNAGLDPVNPKVFRKCKCGSRFAKQVRLGSEMKLINTCVLCAEQWLDGTRDTDVQFDSKVDEFDSKADIDGAAELSDVADQNVADQNEDTQPADYQNEDESDVDDQNEDDQSVDDQKLLTLSSLPTNDNAYVWFLIKGDRYVPGIITSIYSIKRFKPNADLVVMVTDDVSEEARKKLLQYATHLFYVPYLSYPGKFRMQKKMKDKYATWIDQSFTKWNMLALPYKKAFLLDADIIARAPLDEIFDKPTPAGVFAEPMSSANTTKKTKKYSSANSSVTPADVQSILATKDAFGAAASSILLAPSLPDYKLFISTMEDFKPLSLVNETGSDEQSITYFYSIVKNLNWHSLGLRWNTVPWFDKYATKDPLIIHFMSKEKPWEMKQSEWADLAEWYEMYEKAKASIL